ncbi:flavodoxin family protein [Algoriphagus sp. A40]|uniref:flavodoxin family protein n=1 Tax=Algoriphagus sp. A40 TaxID=1945863 RepID=UPI000985281A|nr:flavodoxin family protein [Algoriphagus sp. A40]OOG74329.1 flavodoxin [Algoriphagus sp. A40]
MTRLTLVLCFIIGLAFSSFSQDLPVVLIAYYSKSGNTESLAQAVSEGASSIKGVEVKLLSIDQVTESDLLEASAIIVGSPVYNANVAPAVQEFINSWPFEGRPLKNKLGAAFSTGGGISIGEELVMLNMLHSMLIYGMIVVGGEEADAAFGASAITGEEPFGKGELEEVFLRKGFGLGSRVAKLVAAFPQVLD